MEWGTFSFLWGERGEREEECCFAYVEFDMFNSERSSSDTELSHI